MSGATYRSRGYRYAETRVGDTVQRIAEREMGDPARWPELVAYNGLDHPYIVDNLGGLEDPDVAVTAANVLVAGQRIKVPAAPKPSGVSDPTDIYGTDLWLEKKPGSTPDLGGLLREDPATGDFATITDVENLKQALRHRIATHPRELLWHRDYGNPLHEMIGLGDGPAQLALAAARTERMLRSDPRVADLREVEALADGDRIGVSAVVVATDGRSLPVGTTEE